MQSAGETRLITLTVLVGLTLSGLTVWSVARQGLTLRDRELADLTSQAQTAAAQRAAALEAELHRACDAAGREWTVGGLDALDAWAASQRRWLLAALHPAGQSWIVLPQTPLAQPLPGPRDPNERGRPSDEYDLNATLQYFKRLAMDPDPLTRAGALLASATYEQQLGHPLGAARILADAAQLLRSTPGLARFAFRAELTRIESLLAAGEFDRAEDALTELIAAALADHPGRFGPAEVDQLQQQLATLGLSHNTHLPAALTTLRARAARRQAVIDAALATVQAKLTDVDLPAAELTCLPAATADGEPLVLAARRIAPQAALVLVSPLGDLLARYWPAEGNPAWRVVSPTQPHDGEPLARLESSFGHALLVPSPAVQAELLVVDRRRLGVMLLTALGTCGAWTLVIWMMLRTVSRQRALAHLQSRFVADVSHELKTPLALIRLLAETLAEGRVRDPERVRSYYDTITRESERLSTLLDNILDLGRIESGRKRYEFGTCHVAQVARQAWALYEPQFNRDGFDAQLVVAPDLPPVQADAAALQQVLVNLLQNAYRYAGDGKYVRLGVAREGHLIIFTVEDHGIGMNRAQLQHLGESFFRAEDTRVRQHRGAGLGLAIVNHIITAHRGKLEVHSRPGQGTKFTVWIPCTHEEPRAAGGE